MFPNFEDGAADSIDIGKGRTACDTIQMLGFEDGKLKALVARAAMDYENEVETGRKLNPTVIQVAIFVEQNHERLELPILEAEHLNGVDRVRFNVSAFLSGGFQFTPLGSNSVIR